MQKHWVVLESGRQGTIYSGKVGLAKDDNAPSSIANIAVIGLLRVPLNSPPGPQQIRILNVEIKATDSRQNATGVDLSVSSCRR